METQLGNSIEQVDIEKISELQTALVGLRWNASGQYRARKGKSERDGNESG